ncbi:hypothetical protein RRG08_052485 [Elysia crispata]|uniref:Uncharacterized protein n=1 Tax=Elysia crispata TaxID=231223 RepID=A0AAE1B2W0_9GAST|nr:hypothetical protein RRG08_052485 [Elysia crispata]
MVSEKRPFVREWGKVGIEVGHTERPDCAVRLISHRAYRENLQVFIVTAPRSKLEWVRPPAEQGEKTGDRAQWGCTPSASLRHANLLRAHVSAPFTAALR